MNGQRDPQGNAQIQLAVTKLAVCSISLGILVVL